MMDPLDHVTHALREGGTSDNDDVHALPPERDAAIARLRDALRGRARARERRRALAVAAGFAVLIGGAWAARQASRHEVTAHDLGRVVDPMGSVTALRDGHSETIGTGLRVAEGTELRTSGSSEARLDFDSGTRVTFGGAARVRLVEQSQRKRFALEEGSLFASVAKLGPDERFLVSTPDAEVEVRGTAFRVTIVAPDPTCANGSPTRLEVAEGIVVVRHAGAEHRVAAGERWPLCRPPTSPGPVEARGTTSVAVGSPTPVVARGLAATGAPQAVPAAVAAPAAEASSRLAEQNDLFDEAMRLKRSGNTPDALAKLERLLASYPAGPLAESAGAERMRLLASSDGARAATAAKEYLKRYPRGFARTEAEALAGGAP